MPRSSLPTATHRVLSPYRLLTLLLLALLSACASGPPKRVFPPSASVQELRRESDGGWMLELRLQNFSTVAMRFERISAELELDGQSAGRVEVAIAQSVPPGSAEVLSLAFTPSAAAAEALNGALGTRRGLGYRLHGLLTSSEPGRREDPFDFSSALTPMPGLDGVLR
jgi:hypothetical protein